MPSTDEQVIHDLHDCYLPCLLFLQIQLQPLQRSRPRVWAPWTESSQDPDECLSPIFEIIFPKTLTYKSNKVTELGREQVERKTLWYRTNRGCLNPLGYSIIWKHCPTGIVALPLPGTFDPVSKRVRVTALFKKTSGDGNVSDINKVVYIATVVQWVVGSYYKSLDFRIWGF